jgi:hypothetical protein
MQISICSRRVQELQNLQLRFFSTKNREFNFVHTTREDSELQVITDGSKCSPPAGSPASTTAMPFCVEEKI